VIAVLDHLKIEKAHLVGLSMGGYATLNVRDEIPQRCLSLTLAGTGSGSERWFVEDFRKAPEATATQYVALGSRALRKTYGMGPSRISLRGEGPARFCGNSTISSRATRPRAPPTRCALSDRRPPVFRIRGGPQENHAADPDHLRR